MLKIYYVALQVAGDSADIATGIGRKDADLARQLRRCAASCPLNIAEGTLSQGKNRGARYFNALGSAREVLSCVEVAVAMKYIPQPDHAVIDRMNHVIATLIRLAM